MKRIFFILASLAFIPVDLASQAPSIEWSKCFGGTSIDYANDVVTTTDGGYAIVGSTGSTDGDVTDFHGGSADYWVVKTNSTGILQWQRTYGGSSWEEAFSIIQTNDGGFIIAGHSSSNDGDVTENHGAGDSWIVKIDSLGNIQWQHAYGGSDTEYATSIIQTSDGGYAFTGFSYSNDGDVSGHHGTSDYHDCWVVKLDSEGSIEWQKSHGGEYDDLGFQIIQTSDGEYAVAGYTYTGVTDNWQFWILKLYSNGNKHWDKKYGGTETDEAWSIYQTNDSGFIVGGSTHSDDGDVVGNHGLQDYWVLKLDYFGILQWQKCLGGTSGESAAAILQTPDFKYIIAGASSSDDGDITDHHGAVGFGDYWIVQLDSSANIEWQKSYGGTNSESAYSIKPTIDSGYIVAGLTFSNNGDVSGQHGERDYWLVKLEKPCDHIKYYVDNDGDTFGDSATFIYSCYDTIGYVTNNSDCNDAAADIHPGVADICNSIDDNCDGAIDEDALFLTWYLDADSDDFGNISFDSITCFELTGYVFDSTDCNDSNSAINPGVNEVCNQIDDNCNDFIDEELVFSFYYLDADGDDFGNVEVDSVWCTLPVGYTDDSTDCDDTNPDIYPGAPEILNGIDDDCDFLIDEDLAINETLLQAIKIYPNPTEDILHIEFEGYVESKLTIAALTGQILFTGQIISQFTDIDISNFASGIYLLKIYLPDSETIFPFTRE